MTPLSGNYVTSGSEQLREQLRASVVLAALENIIKHDDDPKLRQAARRRYLELTEQHNG